MSVGEAIPQDGTNQNAGAIPEFQIPQPAEVREDAVIKNVYEPHGNPDVASAERAELYLASRLVDDPEVSRSVVRRSFRLPYPGRVAGPDKIVQTRQKTDEWLVRPKIAAAFMLGSAAVFNVVPAAETTAGLVEQAIHEGYRFFNPLQERVERHATPGTEQVIEVAIDTPNRVGEAEVRHQAVTEFSDLVHDAEQNGATIRDISVEANSSDEFRNDSNITAIDVGNTRLEVERLTITADVLQQIMGKNIPVGITRKHKENLLSTEERDALLVEVQAAGYSTISEVVNAVDAGQNVQPELAKKIDTLFISKRATVMRATVTKPGQEAVTEVRTKETDNPPEMPDVDWIPFIAPVFPIRKREKVPKLRGTRRWAKKTKEFFLKPKIIQEDLNTAWVSIRPEAIQEDHTLAEKPWAHTRKYEALLREDRIKDVLRADFQIPGTENQEPTDKSLRIMFVDHSPADETVEAFTKLVEQFANMQNGALADKISGIFVYPSSSAGKEHGKPEKIALGIDKQYDADTVGVCIPLLELVEMHMDITQDPAELLESFADYTGPLWTLAHEVAGHGSDISSTKLTVEPVRAHGIPGAHIVTGKGLTGHIAKLRHKLASIASQREAALPMQYDITYTVNDANGQPVEITDRVYEGDKRLALAQKVTMVGVKPTQYAGLNGFEHYAEIAAAVTTGMAVPFSEAETRPHTLTTTSGAPAANYVNGYRPTQDAQEVFTNTVGAELGSYPATFAAPVKTTVALIKPEDDPLMREHLVRARKLRFPAEEDMTTILTKVVR